MDYLTALSYRGLTPRIKRLSDGIMTSGRRVYQYIDLGIEPNWYLIFNILIEDEETSISEISAKLKFSHPSVIAIVKKMEKAGYVNISAHKTDKRKQVIVLSKKAKKQLPEMEKVWDACTKAVESIFVDDTFLKELVRVEKALEEKDFFDRVMSHLNELEVTIEPFKKENSKQFAALNEAWLKKYFVMEPIDKLVLHNPQEEIIDKGGKIFMASTNKKVIGTFALLPLESNELELCKMAVNPAYQGRGVGKQLLEFSFLKAKEMNYKSMILYSNTRLESAIHLYRKYGFKELKLDDDLYERANIKMKIDF